MLTPVNKNTNHWILPVLYFNDIVCYFDPHFSDIDQKKLLQWFLSIGVNLTQKTLKIDQQDVYHNFVLI